MGSTLDDLRKLNQDIERKKKEAEKAKLNAGLAEREQLSSRMKAEIKARQEKAGQMASDHQKIKKIVMVIFIGVIAVTAVVVIKSLANFHSGPASNAVLLDNDLKGLDARNEDFQKVTGLIKDILGKAGTNQDFESLDWSDKITDSIKQQSLDNIQKLTKGSWSIKNIGYNDKFGFFNVHCAESSGAALTVRLTEDKNLKLKVAKVY